MSKETAAVPTNVFIRRRSRPSLARPLCSLLRPDHVILQPHIPCQSDNHSTAVKSSRPLHRTLDLYLRPHHVCVYCHSRSRLEGQPATAAAAAAAAGAGLGRRTSLWIVLVITIHGLFIFIFSEQGAAVAANTAVAPDAFELDFVPLPPTVVFE